MRLSHFLRPLLAACLLFAVAAAYAQSNSGLGTWNIANVRYNLDPHWSLFFEAQARSVHFYDDFFYHESKGGVNYRVDKNWTFTAGGGYYRTYSDVGEFSAPIVNSEWRTWLQAIMQLPLDRLRFEHRYRLEQRWTSSGFRQRYRYRLNTTIPLNRRELKPGTLFLTLFDEVFFTNKSPFFERNRVGGGLGYQFSSDFTAMAGYINQYDFRLNNPLARDFLQITLLFELRRQEHHRPAVAPEVVD